MVSPDNITYVGIAKCSELPPGEIKVVEVEGKQVLLLNVNGEFYAVSNVCPHAEAYLSEGWIDGPITECPLHGSRFDVRTGEVLSPPAEDPLPRYPLRISGDDIMVSVDQLL